MRTVSHEYGKHASTKVSPGQVRFIRFCLRLGMSQPRISEIVGCGTTTISEIKLGRRWQHIPDALQASPRDFEEE